MSKELEGAIKYLKKISKEWKTLGNTQIEATKKLEIILQALKNSISKEVISKLIENEAINISGLEVIFVEDLQKVLEENK